MQWIACLVFFCALGMSSAWAQQDIVRVRIKSGISKVFLSGLNLRLTGHEEKFSKVAIPQDRKMEISRVIVAGKTYWQISQGASSITRDVMNSEEALLVQGENLREEGLELPNKILLREGTSGQIDIIGVVPMEEYVFSVLAQEMPLRWPIETLKAQAIAIRSYTMAVLQERKAKAFHVESSVLDQVYKKISMNISPELIEKAHTAVKETEGVYLLNPKGRILKAFYHSDCGGKTVPAGSVWKKESAMDAGVAVDAGCPVNPMARWSYKISKEKFAAVSKDFLGDIRSNEFRQILGFMNLRSTAFEMKDQEGEIEFVGKGFGHRVGMCQWGSRALGLKAYSHQRILKHYYPLASLKQFSDSN
ncbi:SpoIID/LytB domain-containing protein [Bdellovibrio sp. HCB337]|uniref:SpoIID/LytB domain-containing protein n=1 Tax=Bdellovibrio sp. HCB337 TaxID=3394358 RepID=UPI0039A59B1D